MPDGVALDLADQRATWFSQDVRVIVFSNYTTGDLKLLKLRADIHAAVTKDQSLKHLAETIQQLAI